MSLRNVEIVRGQIDAFNRGDFDAALDVLDEDVEWEVPRIAALDAPASGVIRGREEMVQTFARWLEAWESYAFRITEALGHGERVFVAGLQTGRGRNSGLDVTVPTFHAFTLRDGKIVVMSSFSERAEALEAVGLSEQH
jgi:ketosteroid isomerase-like protein